VVLYLMGQFTDAVQSFQTSLTEALDASVKLENEDQLIKSVQYWNVFLRWHNLYIVPCLSGPQILFCTLSLAFLSQMWPLRSDLASLGPRS